MQPTDPDKFTTKAWDAIVEAQTVARRFKHQYMEVEHVLIALLEQEEGLGHTILKKARLAPEQLLQELETFAKRQARVRPGRQQPVSGPEPRSHVGQGRCGPPDPQRQIYFRRASAAGLSGRRAHWPPSAAGFNVKARN
jgi:hypothetical protein